MTRCCGECVNHRPDTQECAVGLSYAAFVRADAPANGCPGFQDRERCAAETQAQSECRPVPAVTLPALFVQWQQQTVKP